MNGWKVFDSVYAPFLAVDDYIVKDDVVYKVIDIGEDEVGFRVTAQDDEWEEMHEIIIGDDERIALVIPE